MYLKMLYVLYSVTFAVSLLSAQSAAELKIQRKLHIPKVSKACKNLKCPAIEEPICVKLKSKNMKYANKTTYVYMLNKCELDYMKCHQDTEAIVSPMKYCDHTHAENTGKKRVKRDLDSDDNYGDDYSQNDNGIENLKRENKSRYDVMHSFKMLEHPLFQSDSGDSTGRQEADSGAFLESRSLDDDVYYNNVEVKGKREGNNKEILNIQIGDGGSSDEENDDSDNFEKLKYKGPLGKGKMFATPMFGVTDDDVTKSDDKGPMNPDSKQKSGKENINPLGQNKANIPYGYDYSEEESDAFSGPINSEPIYLLEKKDTLPKEDDLPEEVADVDTEKIPIEYELPKDEEQPVVDVVTEKELISEDVSPDKTDPGETTTKCEPVSEDEADPIDPVAVGDENVDKYPENNPPNGGNDKIDDDGQKDDNDNDGNNDDENNDNENNDNENIDNVNNDEVGANDDERLNDDNNDHGNGNNGGKGSKNREECPTSCPSRSVMLCVRCQHGVYRTFMSVCHMRMFSCQNQDYKIELISRYPCVMSAPYLSSTADMDMTPQGHVDEPNDDDKVMRFIYCREEGRLDSATGSRKTVDPRCKVFEGDGKLAMRNAEKKDTVMKQT